jgi:superfamily II DNA/RNA helicase
VAGNRVIAAVSTRNSPAQGMMQREPVESSPGISQLQSHPMSKSNAESGTTRFSDLKLSAPLIKALDEIGYETPTPIQ